MKDSPPMKYGFSLSKGQCDWLGVNPNDILNNLKDSKLHVARLGLYWNEIEKEECIYDFKESETLINLASELGYEIILTIGAKAPRWPEFYTPKYLLDKYKNIQSIPESILSEKILSFIQASVERFKNLPSLTTWQVENEPLDASGPDQVSLSATILQQEIDLVRSLDSRKILVTIWGNDMKRRNTLKKAYALKNVDVLGFDIYPKRPFFFRFYKPLLTEKDILKMNKEIKDMGMTPILAELQAEPWEEGFDYKLHPEKIKSISLEQIERNINDYKNLGFETILLWGIEYISWANILDEVLELI